MHRAHGKPVILTEFGADAVPGCHAEPEMFSEEYQAEFIESTIAVIGARSRTSSASTCGTSATSRRPRR